jgi:hypothetical protein
MPEQPEMRAFFNQEWAAGRLTRPMDAVMELLRSPEDFLRKHPIINTFDCAMSGATNAYFRNDRADALRPGSKLGTLSMKTTESFNLESVSGVNAYGYAFPVQGVYTAPSNGPIVWYRLDATGPAMMLTAKLTGCTFTVRAAGGGAIEVSHLQPNQETGLQLNTRMKAVGAAYGRLKYDFAVRSVNVMGVRHGGGWKIWAQKLDKNANPPKILSLNRIWPV